MKTYAIVILAILVIILFALLIWWIVNVTTSKFTSSRSVGSGPVLPLSQILSIASQNMVDVQGRPNLKSSKMDLLDSQGESYAEINVFKPTNCEYYFTVGLSNSKNPPRGDNFRLGTEFPSAIVFTDLLASIQIPYIYPHAIRVYEPSGPQIYTVA